MAMKENKDKERYEAPCTKRTRVGLESGICAGSAEVKNPDEDYGRIEEHQMNSEFNEEFKWTNNTWDEIG